MPIEYTFFAVKEPNGRIAGGNSCAGNNQVVYGLTKKEAIFLYCASRGIRNFEEQCTQKGCEVVRVRTVEI